MDEIRVPIYLITGFLESGKTTFLRFTLDQDYFQIDGKTLLILMEEGEEEYDTKALAKNSGRSGRKRRGSDYRALRGNGDHPSAGQSGH